MVDFIWLLSRLLLIMDATPTRDINFKIIDFKTDVRKLGVSCVSKIAIFLFIYIKSKAKHSA